MASLGLAFMNLGPNSHSANWAKMVGLLLVPISLFFLGYSLHVFITRNELMKRKERGSYSSKYGPLFLTAIFLVALSVNYIISCINGLQ